MRSVAGGAFNYTATRVNGERLFNGTSNSSGVQNQVWIKVETVRTNDATQAIETADITEDILALGVTEEAPSAMNLAAYTVSRRITERLIHPA